ncbi:MAG: spermidine synthase, partial [Actinomycetota bacterium]
MAATLAGPEAEGLVRGPRVRLVLLSALMLFVELALIRWAGSNIVYLSYFSNFVLLGSFLGIGIGFLLAGSKRDLFSWAPFVLTALVAFVLVFNVEIDRSGRQLIYFGSFEATGLPTWVTLPVIFAASATVLATIAQGVARTFARFEPLDAYRLDVIGSIAGIVAFTFLSFLRAPPVVWGVVAALTLAALTRLDLLRAGALVGLVALLAWESLAPDTSWSPYYKITTEPSGVGTNVLVNGIPHQAIESTEVREQFAPIYFLPYERKAQGSLDEVLVVGAGNGTDVAIALAKGAGHVDAVEIDPRLYELGKELHPDKPYDDPRVDVHIDDGRAFLERSNARYDLILFALPDSLTLVSGQSSLRLESYLFTVEALAEARAHLAPGGTFAMYNFYRERWLLDRLAATLDEVYGSAPCIDTVGEFGQLALLTASRDPSALSCEGGPVASAGAPEPATDDYPFLYLRERAPPAFYLLALGLILAASLVAVRVAAGPLRSMRPYTDLFFMGAAFLLLETKSVVQFALLFGTTWVVNALVFTGILLSVLAAIEVARRIELRDARPLYALLGASLVVAFVVPQQALLGLPIVARAVVAIALAFAPIFAANLIFAERFKNTAASTIAFGANLLGAMVGGVLE